MCENVPCQLFKLINAGENRSLFAINLLARHIEQELIEFDVRILSKKGG